jgi:F-type H+-transporting ATPase subunit b
MELVNPGIGLIFWMIVSFGIVLWILKKFAWKPILNALKEREHSIEDALLSAEKAKEVMAKLKADNEAIIREAKIERDSILKEARQVKEKILQEAKEEASEEAGKIIEAARLTIKNEKVAAILDIKNQVAIFSVEIAEKILKQKLAEKENQKVLINKLLDEIKLN